LQDRTLDLAAAGRHPDLSRSGLPYRSDPATSCLPPAYAHLLS
jgi:hypothetical protein